MKKIRDTDYLFLSSYVHARLARMGDGPIDKSGVFDDLSSLAPDRRLVDFFRLKYDYHNAKVLLKGIAAGSVEDRLLSPLGRIEPGVLKAACLENSFGELPAEFSSAMQDAGDTLARTSDPRLSDFILDKAYVSEMLHTAQAGGSSFLIDYSRLFADSIDLRALVRMLKSGVGFDKLDYILTGCGSVAPAAVKALYPDISVLRLYSGTGLAPVIPLAESASFGSGFSEFENQCRRILDEYMASSKYQCFGERPLIYYLYTVEGMRS